MNLPTCISSNRKIRYTVCFVILITLSVLFFIISVCAGSVQIPLSDIWRQFRGEQDELYAAILFQIRIPRTFAAILLGGALALSGYLLQTFFHNPIAGPFVLGISSGAKLFVAVVMIVFLRYSRTLSSVDLIVAAFAGSMLSMFCVLLMSPRVQNMSFLVLIGVMSSLDSYAELFHRITISKRCILIVSLQLHLPRRMTRSSMQLKNSTSSVRNTM